MNPAPSPAAPAANARPFDLSRWFALVSLLSIVSLAVLLGWVASTFVTDRMLRQDGELTMQFVHSLLRLEQPLLAYIGAPDVSALVPPSDALEQFARMPDALRINVYDRKQRLIWSSDPRLIGRSFGTNSELDAALAGRLVVHPATHDHSENGKTEHQNLRVGENMFLEVYVPVVDSDGQRVIGAIEVYKNPLTLARTLRELRQGILFGAVAAASLLYLALFGLVRRADLTMREQQRRLLDNETLAVIGEMGLAVAHGIRNPLAAIRSSAELVQQTDVPLVREAATDIVGQSDRLEAWVRELLSYSRPLDGPASAVPLWPLVGRCLDEFSREMERHRIAPAVNVPDDLPAVRGDPLLLGQILRSLIANAIEAMRTDGQLAVRGEWLAGRGEVVLSVEDNGPGISPEQLQRVGKPFYTTKARGLGVELALARRVIERFGGRLEITSQAGRGTVVRLHMQAA